MGNRRFWGSLQGLYPGRTSTEATRGGSQGIDGHIRGWDLGVRVHGFVNEQGEDEFEVWTTGGSHDTSTKVLVARINPQGVEHCQVDS
jgi:hypothetical protein